MKLHSLLMLGLLAATPSTLLAQSFPEAPEPPVARAPRAPRAPLAATVPSAPSLPEEAQAPTAPPAPKAAPAMAATIAPPAPPRPVGQMINVRIDVVLSDSKGASKTLTMTVADGESGMNRTTSGGEGRDFSFNADASPNVVGSKIRLRLTADAMVPTDAEAKVGMNRLALRQSQTVILNDGDSVEIARAADPVSDRSFVLTVKATIQR